MKKKEFKKIIMYSIIGLMSLFVTVDHAVIADAAEASPYEKDYILEDGSIPKKTWNIQSKGTYRFSGTAHANNFLYTSYQFYGKNRYVVNVHNSGESVASVTVVDASNDSKKYGKIMVDVGDTRSFTVSGIQNNTRFYLRFKSEKNLKIDGSIA